MARRHLRLGDDTTPAGSPSSPPVPEDADLQLKIDHATEIVIDYISRPADVAWTEEIAAWDESSVPGSVQAAILTQLGELWRYRGDDAASEQPADPSAGDDLSPDVKKYLKRFRDPVIA